MARSIDGKSLTRIHIHLFTEDVEKIDKLLPIKSSRNDILRQIIHNHLRMIEDAAAARKAPQ